MSVNVKQNGSLTKVGGLYNTVDIEQELSGIATGTTDIADDDLIVTEQDSNSVWYKKTFSKIWDYIKDKIGIADSGSTFLRKNGTWGTPANNRVTQSPISTSGSYEVLLSGTADNTERTEGANKNASFRHNPSSGYTTIEYQNNGSTTGHSNLALGNNKADGTTGCTDGRLVIYGQSQYYSSIWDGLNLLESNRALYVPNKQGVITTNNVIATDESQKTTVDDVTARRATQAYSTGDHFIVNNNFCTAITDIASGAVLTENTNYVTGAIADYLNVKEGTAEITSGITWCTWFSTAYNKCYRSGNHVSCHFRITIADMPTVSSDTTFITLPWAMKGQAKFGQINKSGQPYAMQTNGVFISANSKSVRIRSTLSNGSYFLNFDYITTDPI